jgi:rapamycin-insensitive companion of mTOR
MTLTVYRKSRHVSEATGTDTEVQQQRQPEPLRLTDQYIALLVLTFTRSGLLEVGNDELNSTRSHTTTGFDLHVSRDNDGLKPVKEGNSVNGGDLATCK